MKAHGYEVFVVVGCGGLFLHCHKSVSYSLIVCLFTHL